MTEPLAASAPPPAPAELAPTLATTPAASAEAAPAGAWPEVSSAPPGPHCPWCSAALPSLDLETCPSCGAQLNPQAEKDLPGLTSIDVAALAWKAGTPPRRNRLLSWISGEDDSPPDTSGASSSAVEPPSLAVRREMLRLELEAEGINLPHDAEPSGADEAAAVDDATSAASDAGEPPPAAHPSGA